MASCKGYLLCIENRGYTASLETRKVYRQLSDPSAEARGMVRVEDESGEDYLYPSDYFVTVDVPQEASRIFFCKPA